MDITERDYNFEGIKKIKPRKVLSTRELTLKHPDMCATGHSRRGQPNRWEPWWQVKEEVIKRGFEFYG